MKKNSGGTQSVLLTGLLIFPLQDESFPSAPLRSDSVLTKERYARRARGKEGRRIRTVIRNRRLLAAGFLALAVFGVFFMVRGRNERSLPLPREVHEPMTGADSYSKSGMTDLPLGYTGLLRGLELTGMKTSPVRRVGTRAEKILVGQRMADIEDSFGDVDFTSYMSGRIRDLRAVVSDLPRNAELMSDYDYENLLRIVEAEAGTEDLKGRALVANVIMNRVRDDRFPDTVTDVIFSYDSGVAQFSPVDDGRIYDVTVTTGTLEAVRYVLEGMDESRGALFFIQKDAADPENVRWFENNLSYLFKHGVHEFYTYPDV